MIAVLRQHHLPFAWPRWIELPEAPGPIGYPSIHGFADDLGDEDFLSDDGTDVFELGGDAFGDPEDLELVKASVPASLELVADGSVERGGLRVETDDGGVEDGPQQWRRALAEIFDTCMP